MHLLGTHLSLPASTNHPHLTASQEAPAGLGRRESPPTLQSAKSVRSPLRSQCLSVWVRGQTGYTFLQLISAYLVWQHLLVNQAQAFLHLQHRNKIRILPVLTENWLQLKVGIKTYMWMTERVFTCPTSKETKTNFSKKSIVYWRWFSYHNFLGWLAINAAKALCMISILLLSNTPLYKETMIYFSCQSFLFIVA